MKEFKGTKGEWFQSHRLIPNDENGMYSTQVYCDKGQTIASISWYPNIEIEGVTSTYREANAKLIAASKDLLEALQSVLDSDNDPANITTLSVYDREVTKKAINKALN